MMSNRRIFALLWEIHCGVKENEDRLYAELYPILVKDAYALLSDRQLAEDVAHETLTAVYRSPAMYMRVKKPFSYIYTSNRNRAKRRMLSHEYNSEDCDAIKPGVVDMIDSPEDQVQLKIMLDTALSQLDDTDRQIVHLRVWQGTTFRIIAQLLKLPISTVQSKYRRSIDKIKAVLSDKDE